MLRDTGNIKVVNSTRYMRAVKLWQIALILILVLASIILISGCNSNEGTSAAKEGSTVKVHYTGKLDDGTVFDTSIERDPLEFTIGDGDVIPGFEQAVIGMTPGELKTVTIPAEEAYGPYDEELVIEVDRSKIPEDIEPEIGMQLQGTLESGAVIQYTVIAVSESTVTLDANHPLAGKDLTFDIELVDIL
jgi:peptidylprolyl isomerase